MVAHRTILASMACMVMLGGYASYPLMPTPNIYAGESGYPEDQVPEALKSNRVDLLYVTDRSPESDENGNLAYGSERSDSIAFGSVMVEIGDDVSWRKLIRASHQSCSTNLSATSPYPSSDITRAPSCDGSPRDGTLHVTGSTSTFRGWSAPRWPRYSRPRSSLGWW